MTTDEFREFTRISSWQFAKTMPQTPHEYTLRAKALDPAVFDRVIIHIREHGSRLALLMRMVCCTGHPIVQAEPHGTERRRSHGKGK